MTAISDPLPFHFLHQQPELCARATFVDVDYPQLMHKKRACISNSAALQELLPFLTSGVSDGPDVWRAGQYLAVGCDLRKLSELEAILKKEVHVHDCAILFVAEVSVAYMDVKSADAVVSWASTFKDGTLYICFVTGTANRISPILHPRAVSPGRTKPSFCIDYAEPL